MVKKDKQAEGKAGPDTGKQATAKGDEDKTAEKKTVEKQTVTKEITEKKQGDEKMAEKDQPKQEDASVKEDVDKVVRNHVLTSMGIGLVPIPLVDLAGLMGVQLNMLRKIGNAYDIPFTKDIVKSIIGTLIGGGVPVVASSSLASLMKSIPVIGQTTGVLSMPILAGALTYAIGKVFTQHFASGGTFLNFDPEAVREYYAQMFQEGQKVATDLKK